MNPHVHDFGGGLLCRVCGCPQEVADNMGAYYNPADPYGENSESSEDVDDNA